MHVANAKLVTVDMFLLFVIIFIFKDQRAISKYMYKQIGWRQPVHLFIYQRMMMCYKPVIGEAVDMDDTNTKLMMTNMTAKNTLWFQKISNSCELPHEKASEVTF